jgi:hypothetical protein
VQNMVSVFLKMAKSQEAISMGLYWKCLLRFSQI